MKKPREHAESSEVRGEETLRGLRETSLRSRVVLILRHSVREDWPAEDPHAPPNETWQLTPEGRVHAYNFGRNMPPFAHLLLTHTRIARTRDTAEEIVAGFRESHPDAHVKIEGVDPALSLTTFYARDLALRDHWKEKLGMQFYHGWLGGHIPAQVLAPAGEAVANLVERLHSKVDRSPESSVFLAVSHDVDVFTIREVLFGGGADEKPWIGYLDGILLTWDSTGHLVARWRDQTARTGPP
jgi:hypothetical protein